MCLRNCVCRLHPLEDYLTAASDAALQMDAPHDVFLTTDDRDLIQYIERGHYDHYGFTFYYTRSVRFTLFGVAVHS